MAIDVLHENGLKADIRDICKDITALKAQNIQVSVDGDQHTVINDHLVELMENDRINKDKIELFTSIVHHQGKQIESLQLSSVATTAMFMANVVHIGGLRKEINENGRVLTIEFLRNRMDIHPPIQEILQAKHLGDDQNRTIKGVQYTFPPLMEVVCSPALWQAIWDNRQVLKGQMDPLYKWKFYVAIKNPEDMKASNNRYKEALEEIQRRNKGKPTTEQEIARIVAGKLTVNGEVVPDPVYVPDVKTIMHLTQDEINGFDKIEFDVSNNYTLSKSTFHGYCTKIVCY